MTFHVIEFALLLMLCKESILFPFNKPEINDAVTHKQAHVGHLQITIKKSIIRCCFACNED